MKEKDTIYVIGHKNPDSDSICSAIAYADYKQKNGLNAVAVRLGELSYETMFILNYFHVNVPPLLNNVKTQVSDLDVDPAFPITPDSTIQKAWVRMKQNNVNTLPVVDENNHLHGLVTLTDIADKFFDTIDMNVIGSVNTTLANITETINGRVLCGSAGNLVEAGKLVVVAMQADHMHPFIEKGDIVIVGNRKDVQQLAIELNVSMLIIPRNAEVDVDILEMAKKNNTIVISCPQDTFTLTKLISQSITVSNVMTKEHIVLFSQDDFVNDIKIKMLETRFRSYPVINDNNVIKGFISRYHLIASRKKKVILVDHNEKSQSVEGIEEADILEIIDHHRYGDIQTKHPISVTLEPVGSTATIVASIFFENAIRPTKQIAGILCAAIISDTMNFKSPTSVFKDKITAEKLADIAGINIEKFAIEMIKESSSIHGKTVRDIFCEDFKEFQLGTQKLAISQIKTMDINCVNDIFDEILDYMRQLCETVHYNLVMLVITDIIKEGSSVIAIGPSVPILEKAFNVQLKNNTTFLHGVVSRKKQIIPPLEKASL